MIQIDLENEEVMIEGPEGQERHALASREAFEIISDAWLRCGWDNKYVYSFTWLGRPVIQMPEDMLRIQEVIARVKPDLVIETGVAHGGSLVFYASLFKAMGRGRVIGIDVEIRPHNREAIESHELFPYITLFEGSSIEPSMVKEVSSQIHPGEKVLVILDSKHTKDHVLAELEAYAPMVTPDSYVIVEDGCMEMMAGAPRTEADWSWNNPIAAIEAFVASNPDFAIEEPEFAFNEGNVTKRVTYWPKGYVRRLR